MPGRVQDKIALITGGASGIGLATGRLMVEEGAKVVLADIQIEAGERAAKELGSRATFVPLDVTREDQWISAIERTVKWHGRLEILVNNAGVGGGLKDIEETTMDDWKRVMGVNLDGVFLGCKYGVKAMKETGGGAIVNLSSIAGIVGYHSLAAYCASKGGVRLLTKAVALHCARKKYNIRCNSVHPSFADTPMVQATIARARNPEKMKTSLEAAAPLGRLGTAREVAQTILFLASDESSFTTGAEFLVDGGATAA
jgi:3(or 17)beta-hydroxysteroid dehydrogenase